MDFFDFLNNIFFPLKNSINVIFGPPAVGKTTFSYIIIKKFLLGNEINNIYYVDTENGFSKRRLIQVFPSFEQYSEKFSLFKIRDFEKLNNFLRKFNDKNSLLIVDSISMPYRLKLKDNFELINKELAITLNELINKAENNYILLVSHSYFKENEHRIVGGDLMKYFSKSIIEMLFDGNKRKIRLIKHKFIEEKEIKIEIKKEGFKIKRFF
ncbi:MAG: hypothetical protein ABGW69_01950 [Nanoarchaeota archaeon]